MAAMRLGAGTGFDFGRPSMNRAMLFLTYLLAAGCAARPTGPSSQRGQQDQDAGTVQASDTIDAEREYHAVPASALVFSPPLAPPDLEPALARSGRDVSAFLGYDEIITEYFYLRVDDRQSDTFRDNYERRAVSEKVGVRYR